MRSSMLFPFGLAVVQATDAVPEMMVAMQAHNGPCEAPDWTCLHAQTVAVPTPSFGHALIEMRGTGVNPVNLDMVEPVCVSMGGCTDGTVGNDLSGIVVSLGRFCNGVELGDEVWGMGSGTYAQYAVASCHGLSLKPKSISFAEAGTLPVVAATALQCLQSAGLPSKKTDVTVVITSGQGGTGIPAIQLAKAMGATRVITAASGHGIELTKSLGADLVIDYHEQEIFDALPDNSVDMVFDNIGIAGTADRAMRTIKSGGTFLVLMGGGGGTISANPKEGVNQVDFQYGTDPTALDQVAAFIDAGALKPVIFASYGLQDTAAAWTRLRSHGVYGKIAVDPTNLTAVTAMRVV